MVIKVRKFFSLMAIIFLMLSNIAFAQVINIDSDENFRQDLSESSTTAASGAALSAASMNSDEMDMNGRFMKGDLSEDELRSIAKSKMGDKFSEIEFQKLLLEMKQRMSRKDAFSFEHEGFENEYDSGPSYEGYSKEQMIYGMLFQQIGNDVDPREIKQSCNEPDKIADTIIAKLKEKIGDFQKICSQAEDKESRCEEYSKQSCSQIRTAATRKDATDIEKVQAVAYSCPVNKEAIAQACKLRSLSFIGQKKRNVGNSCSKRFDYEGERLAKECDKFKQGQLCDKDKFMSRCMAGVKKEEDRKSAPQAVETGYKYSKWECYDGFSDSQGSETSCKPYSLWNNYARKSCEGHCSSDKSKCGVNSFSVSEECRTGTSSSECPPAAMPKCTDGYTLQKKSDEKGCISYYCELHVVSCQADVQQCSDGSSVKRVPPNCNFERCPSVACTKPVCEGAYDTGQKDSNGCIIYTCPTECGGGSTNSNCVCPRGYRKEINKESAAPQTVYRCARECPTVAKPTCNTGETVQAYYDNAGCVTSYQCIKQTSCPEVQKPACTSNQSLTVKYDSNKCIAGYECVNVAATGNAVLITGNAVLKDYDEFMRHCEDSWAQQEKTCSKIPSACDKETFVEKCKEQEKKNLEDVSVKVEKNCETETESQIKYAEQRCSKIEEDRKRCMEHGLKRCEQMKGMSQKCKETMTEANVRKFIIDEVRKRCKFTGLIEDEGNVRNTEKAEIILAVISTATEDDINKLKLFVDSLKEDLKLQDTTVYRGTINPNRFGDIKLMPFVVNAKLSVSASSETSKDIKAKIVAGQKAEDAAGKLVSLRDSNIPDEYLYIIEDKASDVLNVSDNLKDLDKKEEEKGIGYKMKRFFGLAQKSEREEIKQLEESKAKLQNSINSLTKLVDEVPNDVAKSILKEQVENLKNQLDDIDALIKAKQKKAKGLFGIFG